MKRWPSDDPVHGPEVEVSGGEGSGEEGEWSGKGASVSGVKSLGK